MKDPLSTEKVSTMEVKNAIIESASIRTEDGFLDCSVCFNYGGSGQCFGGWTLYLPATWKNHKVSGPNYAGHFIWRVMELAGVTKWEQMKGKTMRVLADHSHIEAIGHIVKDDWFYPRKDFEKAEREAAA